MLWAALVGCVGGLSAIVFRAAFQGVLWCWTRQTGNLEEVAAHLRWWQRLLIPAGGGLTAGLALFLGGRLGRGHRTTDYMEAVAVRRGILSIRQSSTKLVSSVLTIGSGGSIGREGAMVQFAALLASCAGRLAKLSVPRLRLLVACGAAGGIAAVYNVTVAGALFVSEIILGSIAMESLGPLLVAAVASSLVSRFLAHADQYFPSRQFELGSPWQMPGYLAMAFVLGVLAPGYVWLLRRSEELFAKVAPRVWWRLALGGLVVGALAAALPEVWGNGRSMVITVLGTNLPLAMVATILICKVLATAATTGSGAVGGVFTPTMFTGAMIGYLLGQVVAVIPGQSHPEQTYALVGMAGFLAAATRAPLMAIVFIAETTRDYALIVPIMMVSVVAYYTARALQSDSIYSESMRRQQPRTTAADISALRVRDVIKPAPVTVDENASFDEVVQKFAAVPYRHLLMVGLENQLRGVITLRDVEQQLERGEASEWTRAAGLMQPARQIATPETTLSQALELLGTDDERLPVVNNSEDRILLGQVSKTDILLTLAHGLHGSAH